MARIYSNGPSNFVMNPFIKLAEKASQLCLAAPYFTLAEPIRKAALAGKRVQLLVGLNGTTSPEALTAVQGVPSLAVRYLTHRFHAKIYLFDDTALIGSANLTDGGLLSNREAVLCLDQEHDAPVVEEIRALFQELWDSGDVLTDEKLEQFRQAYRDARRSAVDIDDQIERAIGRTEPRNITVASGTRTRDRLFEEGLRREIYEQYRPAFNEVGTVLEKYGLRRPDLASIGGANETNRFLSWLRQTYISGDDAWRSAPLRDQAERSSCIRQYGQEWMTTADPKIFDEYYDYVEGVRSIFGSRRAIDAATKESLTDALMSILAFEAQHRFVSGGRDNLPAEFWKSNDQDAAKVKRSLAQFLHGPGDFISRLHDLLYDPSQKLSYFGYFCALELYGTIKPQECPPMNGRMAKALRFLGFDVRGS